MSVKITGVNKTIRTLKNFDNKVQAKIVRASLRTSTNPIKKELRREIRSAGLVDKKNLVKSITTKLKVYRSTRGPSVFLVVGARRKKLDDGANPANYIHLVGGGVKPHKKKKNPGKPWRIKTNRGWRTLKGQRHPGVKAKRFRQAAANKAKRLVPQVFQRRMTELVKKELTKG